MLEFALRPVSTGDTGPRTVQLVDDLEKLPGTGKYAGKIRIIKDYNSNYKFDEAADEVVKLTKNMK